MGREASCVLEWGTESAACKVLLEVQQLIVRGGIKRRVPLSSMQDVLAQGDHLVFCVDQEQVALHLGQDLARKWAKAIATPPPSLASKFGIQAGCRLHLIGTCMDEALAQAIAGAHLPAGPPTNHESRLDLIVACLESRKQLEEALPHLDGTPVWLVYPKGQGKEPGEAVVREVMRKHGYIDTKVASVSATLTALRFNKTLAATESKAAENRRLRDLQGVGRAMEADFHLLGIATVEQLAACEGLALYEQLCEKTGQRQDPCVLDTLRCAVAQARDKKLKPEQTKWWWWSQERKAGRL